MSVDKPFDRRMRRIRRDRAARRLESADYLHRAAGEELIERLDLVKRSFKEALILGHSGEGLAAALAERGMASRTADPGFRFAQAATGVQCDEDRLAYADATFDLVISIGVLDSVNDLPGALTLIRRVLRPDGLLLAAFAGAGSLPRLREAMFAADEADGAAASPRIHPQIDVRSAGDLLGRAGYALPVADSHALVVRYSGLRVLVEDLRAMGATNVLASRSLRPVSRRGLEAAIADFAGKADPDGKTAERFEIVHLTAWAPPAKG
jgi:SAM-dependent methyltransferase